MGKREKSEVSRQKAEGRGKKAIDGNVFLDKVPDLCYNSVSGMEDYSAGGMEDYSAGGMEDYSAGGMEDYVQSHKLTGNGHSWTLKSLERLRTLNPLRLGVPFVTWRAYVDNMAKVAGENSKGLRRYV
jgi:hypothetical protein